MSQLSHKARMREALLLTEGNLTSLLGARDALGLNPMVVHSLMTIWREQVRSALGHFPAAPVSA